MRLISVGIKRILCFVFLLTLPIASLYANSFEPPQSELDQWDWVQLTSGEWLKGKITVLYGDTLEFDSDVLDDLSLDWDDVQQVRSAKTMNVRMLGQLDKNGRLRVDGDKVSIGADDGFSRQDLLTITSGENSEINYWSVQYLLGANIRSGNTSQVDINSNLKVQRRTVANRFILTHLANFSESTDQVTQVTTSTAKDQRGNAAWDHFISDKFFIRPIFGEYQQDDFQNLDYKYTVGTGAGYQAVDLGWMEWRLVGGPAYQETHYITVLPDEDDAVKTAAFAGVSNLDIDITSNLEFYHDYSFYFVNKESGEYLHHMVIGLNMDLTSLLDYDISLVWDRTENPKQDELGYMPKKNDYRFIISFGLDF